MTELAQETSQGSAPARIADQTKDPIATSAELLTFQCGGRGYAVDIMTVREIRSWSQPTPLPHAPPYMLGMVNLRGSVLPVMDLAQRLGQAPTSESARNVIIVIQQGSRVHGLLVDAVSDIVHPSVDQLQDVPRVGVEATDAMAEKLFVVDDDMIQVLSVDNLLPLRPGMSEDLPR
ncbi:chemotaxis protein CheW [Jannaschia sp. M317]|uniref:chemotaxis protein CheW n=1 Tax=Jannaschia sp. M317 TaxID=2867011 RepID=UPI0021A911BB|nr:chemotaxis protein CheW [Jannaschia sp. M317]UWQ16750.1 chemotaxis protein CheW [Jannaschia sp. M317]